VKLPVEAAMIWNEPNNKSHWDPELDPDWSRFATLVSEAGKAIRAVNPQLTRVLGGMSPIDPVWTQEMKNRGVLDHVEVVAVHGFPLDWNLWSIHEWPDRIAEIKAVVPDHQVWATEVGVGSFGAEEVQVFGIDKTAELLLGRVDRLFWYSLFDLPKSWEATTRTSRRKDRATIATSTWADPRGHDAQACARAFPRPRAGNGAHAVVPL
jgi:beta-xylosidase